LLDCEKPLLEWRLKTLCIHFFEELLNGYYVRSLSLRTRLGRREWGTPGQPTWLGGTKPGQATFFEMIVVSGESGMAQIHHCLGHPSIVCANIEMLKKIRFQPQLSGFLYGIP
jgi:hypothetical protein